MKVELYKVKVRLLSDCNHYVLAFSPEHAIVEACEDMNMSENYMSRKLNQPSSYSLEDVQVVSKEEYDSIIIDYLFELNGFKRELENNGIKEPLSMDMLLDGVKVLKEDVYGVVTDDFVEYGTQQDLSFLE